MAQIISNVFDKKKLANLFKLASKLDYICGKKTALGNTQKIKNNLQADTSKPETQKAMESLRSNLLSSSQFIAHTHASKLSAPIFAKYEPGMTYGFHYDLPIMKQGGLIRTDLSCTVFLNDDYEGGELEIKTDYGLAKLKGKAGDVLLYPSGSYHRVAPVLEGERKVAVLWIQSRVQDSTKRGVLADMSKAISFMKNDNLEESAYAYTKKSYDNLVRMWSDV